MEEKEISKISENNENNENKNSKVFIKSGCIVLTLFITYELLVYFFAEKLNLFAIILFYLPIAPFIFIFNLFGFNYYFIWALILCIYFILGGFLGVIISNIIKRK